MNQPRGRQASKTNVHTHPGHTADTLLERPWHTAVKIQYALLVAPYLISALHSPVLTGLHLYATNWSLGLFFKQCLPSLHEGA